MGIGMEGHPGFRLISFPRNRGCRREPLPPWEVGEERSQVGRVLGAGPWREAPGCRLSSLVQKGSLDISVSQ